MGLVVPLGKEGDKNIQEIMDKIKSIEDYKNSNSENIGSALGEIAEMSVNTPLLIFQQQSIQAELPFDEFEYMETYDLADFKPAEAGSAVSIAGVILFISSIVLLAALIMSTPILAYVAVAVIGLCFMTQVYFIFSGSPITCCVTGGNNLKLQDKIDEWAKEYEPRSNTVFDAVMNESNTNVGLTTDSGMAPLEPNSKQTATEVVAEKLPNSGETSPVKNIQNPGIEHDFEI
jgi:hypothetical protein